MATKATPQDGVNLFNMVRAYASSDFRDRIPAATLANITDVGNPITGEDYTAVQNEFINVLVNRIGMTIVRSKILQNPLAVLKRGTMPLGMDIQELGVNPAEDKGYDPDGADLFSREKPDVKVVYHRTNRKGKYKVTISDEQLQEAFISWDYFNSFVTAIVNSLYSGDYFDEFTLMKETFGGAIKDKKVKEQVIAPVTDANFGRSMVLGLQNASSYMAFPGSTFTAYLENMDTPTGKPFITATPVEDQIIIIRADVKNQIGVDVLSQAFNMSQVDYKSRVLETDNFGPATNALAIVADRSWPQIWDKINKLRAFDNGSGLFRNFFWHHWQVYSYSPLANALALVETETPDPTP